MDIKSYHEKSISEKPLYEAVKSEGQYSLYRVLNDKEIEMYKFRNQSWRVREGRLFLYSRDRIEEIDKAVRSYIRVKLSLHEQNRKTYF